MATWSFLLGGCFDLDRRRLRSIVVACVGIVLCFSGVVPGHAEEGPYAAPIAGVLEEQEDATGTPGAGVIIVTSDRILALVAVGVTSTETNVPVSDDSLWHIGSMTKSITAEAFLRAAEYPEKLLSARLSSLAPGIEFGFPVDGVTMEELLSHRAGLKRDVTAESWKDIESEKTVFSQRRAYVKHVEDDPNVQRGTFSYSNAGYVVASVAAETLTGMSWEEMVSKFVFDRLALKIAGFLAPGYSELGEDPLGLNHGHRLMKVSSWWNWWGSDSFEPVSNGRDGDNPAAMAPAGGIHMSLRDAGVFLQSHLKGLASGDPLYETLHRPRSEDGDYALGWIVRNGIHFHSGSNLRWMSEMYMYPDADIAFAVFLNQGDPELGIQFIDAVTAAIRDAHKNASGVSLSPMVFESDLGSK